MPKVLKVILAIVAVIVGIILFLFIASKIAGYETMGEFIGYLTDYLKYIWNDRIFG